ncbi:MAG: DUF4352 domain-containing protein [Acidobacteriota bacterium]|nr:DUF4352 domain-containing protein [Acidobacteriota bacterium]
MLKRPTLPTLCLLMIAAAAGLALEGCKKESQQTDFQMGERALATPMLYNVVQTMWRTQLGDVFKVRVPDHRFLLISLSATNNGGKTVAVPFFTLEGSNREEYHELQSGDGVDNWFGLLREIAPGETKVGNIVFDVPLASYRLRLTDGGEPGSERLVWVEIPLRIDTDTGVTAPLPGQ